MPRYADSWVTALIDAQVDRYAVLIDHMLSLMSSTGGSAGYDVVSEVLSICPYALKRVLHKYSL